MPSDYGGVIVNGKYQLCAKLGHGSFGDIYKGLSTSFSVRMVMMGLFFM